MSKLKEQLNEAKKAAQSAAKKVHESDAFSKVAQNELVGKAKSTAEQTMQKAQKSKHYRYIKIGLIALAVIIIGIVVFNLFSSPQDNKDALEFAKNSISQQCNGEETITEAKLMGTTEPDVERAGVVKRYVVEICYQNNGDNYSIFRIVQKRESGEFILAGDEPYGENGSNRTRESALERAIDTVTNQGKYKYKKLAS